MWTIYATGYPDCPLIVDYPASDLSEAVSAIVGEWVPVASDGAHDLPLTIYGPSGRFIVSAHVVVLDDVVTEVA
jgi:hypothetical protein